MNNSNHYKGGGKNSGPTRYGNHKVEGTAPSKDAKPEVPSPVSVGADADAARAAVAISSIEARTSPMHAINGTIPASLACAETKVDALDNVPSGKQILADLAKPAESTLPKS